MSETRIKDAVSTQKDHTSWSSTHLNKKGLKEKLFGALEAMDLGMHFPWKKTAGHWSCLC